MEWVRLPTGYGHAVLSEGVVLLLTEHVADLLLPWSGRIGDAGVPASERDARRLLLNLPWMLVTLTLSSLALCVCS